MVLAGATPAFSVTATGTAPLAYQWRKNGTPIGGATASTYVAPAAVLADSGASIDVVVSNPQGSATSAAVALTVKDDMSYLVALAPGSSFGSSLNGAQSIVNDGSSSVGNATVTLTSLGTPVPSSYLGSIALQGFTNGSFLPPLALASTPLSLGNHTAATLHGNDVDRYDVAVVTATSPDTTVLAASVLSGVRGGLNQVTIGNWKHIGISQSSSIPSFNGVKTARGSFVTGTPTADTSLSSLTTSTYSGYAYGGLQFEATVLSSFDEFSSRATASYNATTRQVTITLDNLGRYNGDIFVFSGPPHITTGWPSVLTFSVFTSPLTCTAQVPLRTNTFECTLTNSAGVTGTFLGRFYGAAGVEIGGTFAIKGLIGGGGFNDGIAGAIALKR
jgi:hypothetical protein